MCVKEFLGYNCGHCAMPYLRQCPITSSNPTFPPCKFPAERPIYTNENCHPCSRVLWNAKVLADEEKHRKQHAMGECDCPVIFDAADRERRLRPRSGKGKGKNRELTQGEPSETGRAEGKHRDDRHHTSNFGYEAHRTRDESAGPRHYDNSGQNVRDSQQGWGPQYSQNNTHHYEYTGYHFEGQGPNRSGIDHLARGYGIPQDGFVPHQYLPLNTLMMDQPGSGMKWYPEQQSQLPVLESYTSTPVQSTVQTMIVAPPPTLLAETVASTEHSLFTDYQINFPHFLKHKAASEPAEFRYPPYSSSSESDRVLDEDEDVGMIGEDSPVVVSSSVVENIIPM